MKHNANADPNFEKREAYKAAGALLADQDEGSLRYVALELRRCIESIVYQKLMVYGALLPEASVHQWQPTQAFDALIKIEPSAEETRIYAVGPQKDPGKISEGPFRTIGVDERPKAKWIKKTWHKLGSYLHAEWPFAVGKPRSAARPFLQKTLDELAPLVNNSFSAMMSQNISFECSGCGATVSAMQKAVEDHLSATCLTCWMDYRAEHSGDTFTFYPKDPPVTCECGAKIFVPERQVEIGHRFLCKNCKRDFQIVGFDWKYVVEEADPLEPDASQTIT